jgi:hypothetical protein
MENIDKFYVEAFTEKLSKLKERLPDSPVNKNYESKYIGDSLKKERKSSENFHSLNS